VTALITGIGYIGAALAEALLAAGERVVGLENGFSTVPAAVTRLAKHPRFTLVRGSINSTRSIERAFVAATDPDGDRRGPVVYHLAAQASAHPQAAPPSYTEATNLAAPRLVYEAAARHGAGAFVYGSSFRVYGDELSGSVGESTPYGFIGDLSHLSKVYAEKLLEMYAVPDGVPVANVRLGVVYGLGPVMKDDPRFLTVPNLFCLRTVAGQPLMVHAGANRPIGFLHLDDAVKALRLSAEIARSREKGAWPINAVSEVLGVGEVAAIVEREARARGLSPKIDGAGPLTGPRWSVASSLDAAGFRATRSMQESLGEILDYYRSRQ
jgi:nucleoside-diphosphate-sugar epimerase